jgi:beta-glucosidase
MTDLAFPKGFLWGTATAAHQVEGNNTNTDWWDWEQAPGHVRNGDRSGLACDQWHRYEEDLDLAASMGNNAHRLGVEWARLEPRPGEWSGEAFAHYRQVLQALRRRGLEPMVTLHHFVNPRWFVAGGGWESPGAVRLFERYTRRVMEELGDLVTLWCTLNEPGGYVYHGWVSGDWPPQRKSLGAAWQVLKHLLLAHAASYHAIHDANPSAQVGIAHHWRIFDPADPGALLDRWGARFRDAVLNRPVLDAQVAGKVNLALGLAAHLPEVHGTFDYLGLNYYHREHVAFDLRQPAFAFTTALPSPDRQEGMPEWFADVYPEGLHRLCMQLSAYGKPIYITENGLLDNTDERRPAYILRHLTAVHRAIEEGAPVLGYFYWSLLDNFEWAEGYATRFGLVHTDFQSQKRTMKRSGLLYGEICRTNGITDDMVARYAPQLGLP